MIRPVTQGVFRIICDSEYCHEEITVAAENGFWAYQNIRRVGWTVLLDQEDLCRNHKPEESKKLSGRVGGRAR